MKRHRYLLIASLIACVVPALVFAQKPTGTAAPAAPPADPPTVASLASQLEQFHWGTTHLDVARAHNQAGGIFDQDYNPQLAKMQPGVAMQAVEAERESKKAALSSTFSEFKDVPLGYDRTGIKDEYTYKNHEALMYVDRVGRRRYFFYIGTPPAERLWKIYDEVPLKDGGPWGKTYAEAVTKMQLALSTPGRFKAADPGQSIMFATVDWQDQATHLRLLDRSNDPSGPVVGIVLEDRAILATLSSLRINKAEDLMAIDPSISAVTRGVGRSDPNAGRDAGAATKKK